MKPEWAVFRRGRKTITKKAIPVEDLRAWLKGATPLLKPQYKTNPNGSLDIQYLIAFYDGVEILKRELLAELDEGGGNDRRK